MNSGIPREVSHVYTGVEKAKKFSVLPRPFAAQARNGMDKYVDACMELLRASSAATIHSVKWFRDNPRFSEAHAALDKKLGRLLDVRRAGVGVLPRGASRQDIEWLWSRNGLEGIFRCAVLLRFETVPETSALFSVCSGPHVVQGANQAYRSVTAIARKIASHDEVAFLFRSDEIEIFASSDHLETLFVEAYRECSD